MILVCGEALIDLFLHPGSAADIPARAVPGGSPFNVAIGLSRLGCSSAFLGGLSNDAFGQHLSAMLTREHVDLSLAIKSSRLTTISVVSTDTNGSPSYAFHGEQKADRMVRDEDVPSDLAPGIQALTFGSYTLAVEPVGSAYLKLAQREHGNRLISLDPNIRPTVTPDITAWKRQFEQFVACADIIKASDEDIFIGYGANASIRQIAKRWLDMGAKLVVITRGPEGAVAFTADQELSVNGRPTSVVDTVGAGDTFHAALLARLAFHNCLDVKAIRSLRQDTLREAVRYAITASSITCSRRGADLPNAAEVERALHAWTET